MQEQIQTITADVKAYHADKCEEIKEQLATFDDCEGVYDVLEAECKAMMLNAQDALTNLPIVTSQLVDSQETVRRLEKDLNNAREACQMEKNALHDRISQAEAKESNAARDHANALQDMTAERDAALNNLNQCEQTKDTLTKEYDMLRAAQLQDAQEHDQAMADLRKERDISLREVQSCKETERHLKARMLEVEDKVQKAQEQSDRDRETHRQAIGKP